MHRKNSFFQRVTYLFCFRAEREKTLDDGLELTAETMQHTVLCTKYSLIVAPWLKAPHIVL